ncbi:MAG: hypothetical protein Q9216_006427 [Gyalolechia sp. 2 TL-2023]
MKMINSQQQYKDLVSDKARLWIQASRDLLPAGRQRGDTQEAWAVVTADVKPQLINVVDGEAIWRIPYCGGESTGDDDDNRRTTTYLTEAIASTMAFLDGRRWHCFAVGWKRNEGDVLLKGPLAREEIAQLQRGQFPRSLELYGVPAPGVCGASHAAGPARGSRGQQGAHPPRESGPPLQGRGQVPHPPPGPPGRGHQPRRGHRPPPPDDLDSQSSISSGTETTDSSIVGGNAGRVRRRKAQQALALGVAALGLEGEDGDERPSGHDARGGGKRAGPPGHAGRDEGPPRRGAVEMESGEVMEDLVGRLRGDPGDEPRRRRAAKEGNVDGAEGEKEARRTSREIGVIGHEGYMDDGI